MINAQALEKALCSTFCSSITVNTVPCGYAVSTVFKDRSGDRLGFYIVKDEDGYRIEDDGDYLSRLIASGIDIENGTRKTLMENILQTGGAFWDVDTFEIKTEHFNENELAKRMTDFLSSLIRVRDIELITRDVVRSTFREDAIAAIQERYSNLATFNENTPIDRQLSDFPSDLNIVPKTTGRKSAAVFFVTNSTKLDEAVMLRQEARIHRRDDFVIIAMIETAEMPGISKRKFQRAVNRSIITPIFRGDEESAVIRIGEEMGLAA
ncbi:MAG: DUF1828 domain-containing protein [Rhodospirillales bacterium]|nr:DUF1828 domain-containing protein [Rhodospirillales bacterium]